MGDVVSLGLPRVERQELHELHHYGTVEPFRIVLARSAADGGHPLILVIVGGAVGLQEIHAFAETAAGRALADAMGDALLTALAGASLEWTP